MMNDDQGDEGSSDRNYLPDAINSMVNEIINKRFGVQKPPDKNIGSNYTEKQFIALVELMDSHNIKLLPGIEGRVKHDNMWLKISKHLNSIEGGCNKTADEWKKIWNNKKRQARRKYEKNPLSITLLEDKIVRISQRNGFDPDEDGPNLGMQSEEIIIEPHFSEFDIFEGGSPPNSPPPAEIPVTPHQIPPQQQPVQPQQSSLPQQRPTVQPNQPSFPAQQPMLPPRQPSISAQYSSFTPQQPLNSAQESLVTPQQSSTSAQQTSLKQKPQLFPQLSSVPIQKPPVPEQQARSTVSHISSPMQKPESAVTQKTIVIDPIPGPSTTNPRKREAPKAGIAANVYDSPIPGPSTTNPRKREASQAGVAANVYDSPIPGPSTTNPRKREAPKAGTAAVYDYKVKQARLELDKTKEQNRKERELLRLELDSRRIVADEQLIQALNRLADNTQTLIDKFG